MKVTSQLIFAIAPSAKPDVVAAIVQAWPALSMKYSLTDEYGTVMFLGECAAECSAFNRFEESLFYTSTKRLREVWPARFKTEKAAEPYVRNPQKLANLVYGGRFGNTKPNDGWDYRGSGAIQTTFLDNFKRVKDMAKIDCVSQSTLR